MAQLALFHPTARKRFGERILYLDLDLVILSDITSLLDEPRTGADSGA